MAALEGLPAEEYMPKWIGWPGASFPETERRKEVERTLVQEHGCIPVFLDDEEAEAYYEGFSNSSVWPLLHYLPNYLRYETSWWDHYRNVNQRFADKVLESVGEGDLVWVHDYQLMLLPGLLKAAAPHLRVGFFLHTPFPVYEVFRCHPRARELVSGMLGADRIGFHTFGYLRHYCGAVQRLLGVDPELTHIRSDGHSTALGVYPIGINAAKFEETLDSPEFSRRRDEFRASHAGKKIVLSVERMDYTKGILHRLEAIDDFLSQSNRTDEVRFIFVSVPSREGIEEYQALREEVETQVGRLNGRYSTLRNSPIHFIHGSVEFTDLCAMYALADVALVTPLIDGMNLVAKEFLACQRENAGLLILSEFAGAAEELFNAFLVNPYDAQGVAESVSAALAMPAEEKSARSRPMRERVLRYDARHWARSYIKDLASCPVAPPIANGRDVAEARAQIREALGKGGRVALFLDYDGTLREIEREPKAAAPGPPVFELLDRLRDRPNLSVTIISGRTQSDLEQWFGQYPFGLIAEHGAGLRRAGETHWEQLDSHIDYGWKAELLPILQLYQEATPGSFIEDKRSSLVWHYRNANPEFGNWKAHELVEELGALAANELVQVRRGKKIVEVTASQVNKGMAVARALDEDPNYAVALCAGDDVTDESMFRLAAPRLLTVRVGDGPTQAAFRARDPRAFRRFLEGTFLEDPGS